MTNSKFVSQSKTGMQKFKNESKASLKIHTMSNISSPYPLGEDPDQSTHKSIKSPNEIKEDGVNIKITIGEGDATNSPGESSVQRTKTRKLFKQNSAGSGNTPS